MNRLWIGIGLLIVLLAGGAGLFWGSGVFFDDFSQNMEEAGQSALAGDWLTAGQKMEKSRKQWEKYRHFWASFTDHEPVEQVQALFSQLELYNAQKRNVEFASACRALAHVAEAIEESHGLRWWSIL